MPENGILVIHIKPTQNNRWSETKNSKNQITCINGTLLRSFHSNFNLLIAPLFSWTNINVEFCCQAKCQTTTKTSYDTKNTKRSIHFPTMLFSISKSIELYSHEMGCTLIGMFWRRLYFDFTDFSSLSRLHFKRITYTKPNENFPVGFFFLLFFTFSGDFTPMYGKLAFESIINETWRARKFVAEKYLKSE